MNRFPNLRLSTWLVAAAVAALAPSCGSDDSPSNPGSKQLCQPGSTQPCTGPAACQGGQTCASDGKSWGSCDCGAAGSGGGGAGGTGGVDASAGGGGVSGSGGSSGASGGSGTSGSGGSSGAPQDGGSGGAPPKCPVGKGPMMVDIGAFCIDSTEVTNAQYDVFAAEAKTKPPTQSGWCATNNTDFEKTFSSQGAPANHAVGVDWCDAQAFCAWAGKRLCGKIGGGALAYGGAEPKDPNVSEHAYACTQGATTQHPYGDTYDKSACNYTQPPPVGFTPKPVASYPGCTGQSPPYNQVFDLVGNGAEWLDACDFTVTFPGTGCTLAFDACAAAWSKGPLNVGLIRCCK